MLKVLHVGKFFYPDLGGMETVLKLLVDGLVEYDVEVSVICSSKNIQGNEEIIGKVKVYRLSNLADVFGQSINPMLFFKMYKLAKEVDIIHIHSPNPLAELYTLLLPKNIKVVMTHHSDVINQKILKIFYHPIFKKFLRRVNRIIVPTDNHITCSPVIKYFKSKCSLAPFGIIENNYLPTDSILEKKKKIIENHGDYLLFVGRLVGYKGLDVLIKAMKNVEMKAIIIGDGPLKEKLSRQAIKEGVEEKVIFVGKIIDDVEFAAYFHGCQFFVLPSTGRNENFGMVQLEAMACKKPVITTNLKTGVPCVGIKDVTTLLVEPGDSQGLANAINKLHIAPELCIKMGQNGHQRLLDKYTLPKMAEAYLNIYKEVLKSSSLRSTT